MQERYIAPAIMLTAGAITSIFNIINQVDVLDGLKRLLLILIIFYIIGRIATKILRKVTTFESNKESSSTTPSQDQDNQEVITEDEQA